MSVEPAAATSDGPVAVIGGGPAGATIAIRLARRGLPVVVVERGPAPGDKPGETLPPAIRPILERLGLWEAFLETGPLACYGNQSAWGGDGRLSDHDFIGDPYGPGWHVDRPAFDALMLGAARAVGARILGRTELAGIDRRPDGTWRLRLRGPEGPTLLAARFVVDATGRRAAFARRRGARRHAIDRLVGVTSFLRPRGLPIADTTTLVEAVPDGWWYSALLPDGRLAAMFFTDPDLLAARPVRSSRDWAARLAEAAHTRSRTEAGGYWSASAPFVVAAGSAWLDPPVGDGWLAIGDAALSFDPLSSHGIGSALSSGLAAADALAGHLAGDSTSLRAYLAQRRRSYHRYLWLRHAYYSDERRWPDAPFWRRRREVTELIDREPVHETEGATLYFSRH